MKHDKIIAILFFGILTLISLASLGFADILTTFSDESTTCTATSNDTTTCAINLTDYISVSSATMNVTGSSTSLEKDITSYTEKVFNVGSTEDHSVIQLSNQNIAIATGTSSNLYIVICNSSGGSCSKNTISIRGLENNIIQLSDGRLVVSHRNNANGGTLTFCNSTGGSCDNKQYEAYSTSGNKPVIEINSNKLAIFYYDSYHTEATLTFCNGVGESCNNTIIASNYITQGSILKLANGGVAMGYDDTNNEGTFAFCDNNGSSCTNTTFNSNVIYSLSNIVQLDNSDIAIAYYDSTAADGILTVCNSTGGSCNNNVFNTNSIGAPIFLTQIDDGRIAISYTNHSSPYNGVITICNSSGGDCKTEKITSQRASDTSLTETSSNQLIFAFKDVNAANGTLSLTNVLSEESFSSSPVISINSYNVWNYTPPESISIMGNNLSDGLTTQQVTNHVFGSNFTASYDGTIDNIYARLSVNTEPYNTMCAVFNSSSHRIGATTEKVAVNGWNVFNLTSSVSVEKDEEYTLACMSDSTSIYYNNSYGSIKYYSNTGNYGDWGSNPAAFSTFTGTCNIYTEIKYSPEIFSLTETIPDFSSSLLTGQINYFNITASLWGAIELSNLNFTVSLNTAPNFNESNLSFSLSHTTAISLQINASDADNTTLTYSINDTRFSINSNSGLITKAASPSNVGTYNVTVNVTDGMDTISMWVYFEITNSAPEMQSARIDPTTAYTGNILQGYCNSSDTDAENLDFDYIWYKNDLNISSGNISSYDYFTASDFNFATTGVNQQDLVWDGSYWWILVADSPNKVYKYNSNGVYQSISYDLSDQVSAVKSISVKGSEFFILDDTNDEIYVYNSTFGYTGTHYDVSTQTTSPKRIYWDGNNWFLTSSNTVYKYSATWSFVTSYDLSSLATSLYDINYYDGYWWVSSNSKAYQFDNNFNYQNNSFSLSYSFLGIADKDNKMYSLGYTGSRLVQEYEEVDIYASNQEYNLINLTSSDFTKDDNITFSVRAFDGTSYSAWINSSEITIQNSFPVPSAVSISPSSPEGLDDLNCSYMFTDADGDSLIYDVSWYVDGSYNSSFDNETLIDNGNTSFNESWICSVRASDGTEWSIWTNSSATTIQDLQAPILSDDSLSSASGEGGTAFTIYLNVYDIGVLDYVRVEITDPNDLATNFTMTTSDSGPNYTYSRTYTPNTNGNYSFIFYVSDGSGNNNSLVSNLTYTRTEPETPPPSGGGGGGGGSIRIDEVDLEEKVRSILQDYTGAKIIFYNPGHNIQIKYLPSGQFYKEVMIQAEGGKLETSLFISDSLSPYFTAEICDPYTGDCGDEVTIEEGQQKYVIIRGDLSSQEFTDEFLSMGYIEGYIAPLSNGEPIPYLYNITIQKEWLFDTSIQFANTLNNNSLMTSYVFPGINVAAEYVPMIETDLQNIDQKAARSVMMAGSLIILVGLGIVGRFIFLG